MWIKIYFSCQPQDSPFEYNISPEEWEKLKSFGCPLSYTCPKAVVVFRDLDGDDVILNMSNVLTIEPSSDEDEEDEAESYDDGDNYYESPDPFSDDYM